MSPSLILILNGPNLNMLGLREPEIYGTTTLDDIHALCSRTADKFNLKIDFRQSNHEGELVTWINQSYGQCAGIIINAAAYTHTSIAIHDALKMVNVPIVEVHLTDPSTREPFRHVSFIESVAKARFIGHGPQSYVMALEALRDMV